MKYCSEKSGCKKICKISQLFAYKTVYLGVFRNRCRYRNVRPVQTFVVMSRSFHTTVIFFQVSCLLIYSHKCKQKNHKAFSCPLYLHFYELLRAKKNLVIGNIKKLDWGPFSDLWWPF